MNRCGPGKYLSDCGGANPGKCCTTCPVGQYTTGCERVPYEPGDIPPPQNYGTCSDCTNTKPANSSYSGEGSTTNKCPWTCNENFYSYYYSNGPIPSPPAKCMNSSGWTGSGCSVHLVDGKSGSWYCGTQPAGGPLSDKWVCGDGTSGSRGNNPYWNSCPYLSLDGEKQGNWRLRPHNASGTPLTGTGDELVAYCAPPSTYGYMGGGLPWRNAYFSEATCDACTVASSCTDGQYLSGNCTQGSSSTEGENPTCKSCAAPPNNAQHSGVSTGGVDDCPWTCNSNYYSDGVTTVDEETAAEHNTLNIPADKVIVRAWYGDPAYKFSTERGYDVTDKVKMLCSDGCNIVASNDNFGDPVPMTAKVLIVELLSGYVPSTCNTCTVASSCSNGQYLSKTCTQGGSSLPGINPTCTACTNSKPVNSSFSGNGGTLDNCPWTCNSNFYFSGSECAPCIEASSCPSGQYLKGNCFSGSSATSNTPLVVLGTTPTCTNCNSKPANSSYSGNGGTTADGCPWTCNPGYYRDGNMCRLIQNCEYNTIETDCFGSVNKKKANIHIFSKLAAGSICNIAEPSETCNASGGNLSNCSTTTIEPCSADATTFSQLKEQYQNRISSLANNVVKMYSSLGSFNGDAMVQSCGTLGKSCTGGCMLMPAKTHCPVSSTLTPITTKEECTNKLKSMGWAPGGFVAEGVWPGVAGCVVNNVRLDPMARKLRAAYFSSDGVIDATIDAADQREYVFSG